MNCTIVKTLLSEFVDERLEVSTAWKVQAHLSECAACRRVTQDMESMRQALQTLPTQQPSANFESALAQRLALTRRPEKRRAWGDRIVFLRRSLPLLRPAFALGVAATAIAGILLLPTHLPSPKAPAESRSTDHAFVADCVAQRRRDAAGEPLADLSAQNLAGHFDNAALPDAAPTLSDSEVF